MGIAIVSAPSLAGCLGVGDGADQANVAPQAGNGTAPAWNASDVWQGRDRLVLYNRTYSGPPSYEADALCLAGGGPLLSRTDAPAPPGTDHLEIDLQVPPTTGPGIQVGYTFASDPADHSSDQEGLTWTQAVVSTGERTFQVTVDPSKVETGETEKRWAFYHRLNPGQDELCYTGVSIGGFDLGIAAVRG